MSVYDDITLIKAQIRNILGRLERLAPGGGGTVAGGAVIVAPDHASRHSEGAADEVLLEDVGTAETDTTLVPHPDGAGGVDWGADAGGATPEWLSNFFADNYPGSPNAMDDEFDDSSGMSGSVNGLNARWTWRNQSTSTFTFPKQGYGTLTIPAAAADNWRGIEQTLPAAQDWMFEVKMSFECTSANTARGGIALIDATNGDLYTYQFEQVAPANQGASVTLGVHRWNSVSSFNSNPILFQDQGNAIYVRIGYTNSSTLFAFWWSRDGISWVRQGTLTDAVVATRIGLFASETNNTGLTKLNCDYFRRIL